MDNIINKVGSVVEGNNFFGRKKELKRAWELIEDGNSLILAAPRRVGKSSFAKKMIEISQSKNWKGFYVDLEKSKTETNFIKQFLIQLKGESWLDKFSLENFKVSVSEIDISFDIKKQSDIYQKIDKVLPHNEDTLIVIDELTVFLNNLRDENSNIENIAFFLNWLRGLRQTSGTKIRWIFCSSISIESFANSHSLSYTLNDITSFPIDELKGNEPNMLLQALAQSKQLDFQEETIQYVLEKLSWKLPYFIQLLFKEIVDLIDEEKEITTEIIDKAYHNSTSKSSIHFNTWFERLNEYADDKQHALVILKELSKIKAGKSRTSLHTLLYKSVNDADKVDDILNRLLLKLENEGYVMMSEKKYVFRSPFLRDFWYNRFII